MLFPSEHEFVGFDVSISVEVEEQEKPLHLDQRHRVVFGVVVSRVEQQLTRVLAQAEGKRKRGGGVNGGRGRCGTTACPCARAGWRKKKGDAGRRKERKVKEGRK